MSRTNVGANLVFALQTTIVFEPMSEVKCTNIIFGHSKIDSGFCSRANTRFAPTFVYNPLMISDNSLLDRGRAIPSVVSFWVIVMSVLIDRNYSKVKDYFGDVINQFQVSNTSQLSLEIQS